MGVPVGRHLISRATVCADPISWFQRGKYIANPSCFILGQPGLGKSTLVRRMLTGQSLFGVIPLVLGDTKPDYSKLIAAHGGAVIPIGPGHGSLNVLDVTELADAARRLRSNGYEDAARRVEADALSRRFNIVAALITIVRRGAPTDREEAVLERALEVLDDRFPDTAPVLADLLAVVQEGPAKVREVTVDRGDFERYKELTEPLEASLMSIVGGRRFGETFGRPTTQPLRRDLPSSFDVSGIPESDEDMRAAALLACWSVGFGIVNAAQELGLVGLEPMRHYQIVLDELWRTIRVGFGMVDRVDALTRLNRTIGVGVIMASHTFDDLNALSSEEDIAKAKGFLDRAGMVICAGMPPQQMAELRATISTNSVEEKHISSWNTPLTWSKNESRHGLVGSDLEERPAGVGKFLIKVGTRPGIPFEMTLTPLERDVNDTNEKWHTESRYGDTAVPK